MPLNEYYEEELLALRELGKEFAETHAASAGMLAHQGADPDVDRLMQGFAFLGGRIREKLDDEFPEIVSTLMELVSPQYLRPIPGFTILQFTPRARSLTAPDRVAAGSQVLSQQEFGGVRANFRTTRDLEVAPIELRKLALVSPPGVKPRIELELRPEARSGFAEALPRRVVFHAHGDYQRAAALHRLLVAGVRSVSARPIGKESPTVELQARPLSPLGFGVDDALLPGGSRMVPGQWLPLEYFSMPQKFLFCSLDELEPLRDPAFDAGAEIVIQLDEDTGALNELAPDELRLHCVPAVNLFPADLQPVRVQAGRSRYRVLTERPRVQWTYSIDRVAAPSPRDGDDDMEFPQFFRSAGATDGSAPGFYFVEREPGVGSSPHDVYLRFVERDGRGETPGVPAVSMEGTATNGSLVESIDVGDLNQAGPGFPTFVSVTNLLRPTRSVAPPLGSGLHRRLIAHLTLGLEGLTSVEALREVLALHDFAGLASAEARKQNTRRALGIQAVSTEPAMHLRAGYALPGLKVRVDVSRSHFAGDGDLHLFGSILDQMLGRLVAVNSFTKLELHEVDHDATTRWPPRAGEQVLL